MKENKADRDFEDNTPIIWAPKVTPEEIRRLYQTDTIGIKDEFLIDDVGCGLYARCRTIWIATERRCLECTAILVVDKIGKYSVYVCPDCGWIVRRRLYIFSRVLPCEKISHCYHRSWRRKRIIGGSAYPVFLTFMKEFARARDYRQKMLAIDRLIHEFHRGARPVNVIVGRAAEIGQFLDELAYGDASTPGVRATKEAWRQEMRAAEEVRRQRCEMQEAKGEPRVKEPKNNKPA